MSDAPSEAARQAQLQRLFGRKLTQQATITTPGDSADDEGGGYTPGAPTVVTVGCRVGPIGDSPQERAIATKHQSLSLWMVKVPAGTAVPDSATITIQGQDYAVVEALGPRSLEIVRRIACRRIEEA